MGLMRSRLRGAAIAKGDTMTFLDAHVEVTNGWLPPLLFEIKKNRFETSYIYFYKYIIILLTFGNILPHPILDLNDKIVFKMIIII